MASIVSAGTTSATALNMSADTSGVLQLASNNGTVGLTLDTSQNVGVGTTSPGHKLQVNGAICATGGFGTASANTIVLDYSSGTGVRVISTGTNTSTYNPIVFSQTYSDGSGYVERGRIDASGRFLRPYQTYVLAVPPLNYPISNDTTISGTWTTISNVGSNFNTTGGVFTAPVTGTYSVTWALFFNATAAIRQDAYILKNSTIYARLEQGKWGSNSTNNSQMISIDIPLTAGDTITFGAYCSSATPSATYSSGQPWQYASIYLLG